VVLSSSFVVLGSPDMSAQRGQPIYPAYDGYLKKPDGSRCSGTSPMPAPQPAGEQMLQSNWNLAEDDPELSRIDFGKAPRGVCVNRAPIVRLLGDRTQGRGLNRCDNRREAAPVWQRERRGPARVTATSWLDGGPRRHEQVSFFKRQRGAHQGLVHGGWPLRTRIVGVGFRVGGIVTSDRERHVVWYNRRSERGFARAFGTGVQAASVRDELFVTNPRDELFGRTI
jgi:hypothetical protein